MRLPRPSAPLAVSFLALFVALGGVSWAAIHLPPHSVGNAQLQNFSVGNAKLRPFSVGTGKIIPGAVGAGQVNSSQVQLRVAGPCTDGAMQSIAQSGDVTCMPVLPNEYGSNTAATTLGARPDAGGVAVARAGVLVPGAGLSARGDQRNRGPARGGRLHALGPVGFGHAAAGQSDDHD